MAVSNEGADVVSVGAGTGGSDKLPSDNTPARAATQPPIAALVCPTCGRRLEASRIVAYLLPYIAEHPGLSTWELSQATSMDYRDVSRALQKAREWKALEWTGEAREVGGTRYRYRVAADWQESMERGLKCPQTRGRT